MVKELSKSLCWMTNGCAVFDFGGAEPIRFQEFKVVQELLAEMCSRREIYDVLARCFALIGPNWNLGSGFCWPCSCDSEDPPTSQIWMLRLGLAIERICCALIG